MTLMKDADNDMKERARMEWNKFEQVADFHSQITEYELMYYYLQRNGLLDVIGSSYIVQGTPPKHDLPPKFTEQTWTSLSLQDQFNELCRMAIETEPYVEALLVDIIIQDELSSDIDVTKGGPKHMLQRQQPRRRTNTANHDDDIRHVIDMSRCSIVMEVERLSQVKSILDSIVMHQREEWEIVGIQDGFDLSSSSSSSNYITSSDGYRDVRVQAKCLQTGYVIQLEFHLKFFRKWKRRNQEHHHSNNANSCLPITHVSQVMDMSLLPEISNVGLEALNDLARRKDTIDDDDHYKEEKVEILLRLGELKLLEFPKLSYDDQSLQKATLASKAVHYFDQALRITQTIDGFDGLSTDWRRASTYCRLLIGLSQGLCYYDWSIYHADRYHDNVSKKVELAPIVFPEMNKEDSYYGIDRGIEDSIALGERHPIALYAKYVKADVMGGRKGIDYIHKLVQEQRRVVGYDHPMVFETLISRYAKIQGDDDALLVWEALDALNDVVEILQVNLARLGMHHPCVVRLLLCLCVTFQSERKSFFVDAPGSKVPELLRILSHWNNNWDESTPSSYSKGLVHLLEYALTKTVHSPDASKFRVHSRVAVWSWEHQNYWSGTITEMMKQGHDDESNTSNIIIHVEYDLPGNHDHSEWISPLRRHTLLLSHGSHEPTPLTITTRTDAGRVESVTEGDHIYVYWDSHKTYWLGKVLGRVIVVSKEEEEEKKEELYDQHQSNNNNNTKFRIQFYSGDLHVCDLSKMKFYPERHALIF